MITAPAFLKTLGVNAHIPYTDGRYANLPQIAASLNYVGIKIMRTGLTNGQNGSAPISSFITLAKEGYQYIIGVDPSQISDAAGLTTYLALAEQIESAAPGSVVAFEGANEINNYPFSYTDSAGTVLTGFAAALQLQQDLYAAVKGNPVWAAVPVVYMTGYPKGSPDPLLAPVCADYDNQHPYPATGQAPAIKEIRANILGNTTNATEPTYLTETGYNNTQSPYVQAAYGLDLFMDAAAQNVACTCWYELFDAYKPGTPQGDVGWGLFDYLGYPKPIARGLHVITEVLADSGTAGFAAIPAVVTGLPATGQYLQIQKSDGSNVFVLWAEPPIMSTSLKMDVDAPAVPVTISLAAPYQNITVYDPFAGVAPVALYQGAQDVTVQVTDHPILIHVDAPAVLPNAVNIPNTLTVPFTVSVPVTLTPTDAAYGYANVSISVEATPTSAPYGTKLIQVNKGQPPETLTVTEVIQPGAAWKITGHNATFGPLTIS